MSGASIRFSKMKQGTGGADAWRDGIQTMKRESGRPRTTGTKLPKVYSIHKGSVVSMQPFGCFVQLGNGDTYKDGLLHVSCLCETRVESPEEVGLQQGMTVWVKVTETKEDGMKISLDMRYVSQKDGTDLDPYQAKGPVPDNFFEGGRKRAPASKVPEAAPPAKLPEPDAAPTRKRKAASEDDESEDREERAKVSKKLEKARKKLEKARKKAEKARKKLSKKEKSKSAKKKASSDSSSSESE